MVERPADVLPMNPAKPLPISTFMRVDRAIRQMPGLGIIIAVLLIVEAWERRYWIGLGWLLIGFTAMLASEFLPRLTTGSLPKSSGVPSAPPRRPDPA